MSLLFERMSLGLHGSFGSDERDSPCGVCVPKLCEINVFLLQRSGNFHSARLFPVVTRHSWSFFVRLEQATFRNGQYTRGVSFSHLLFEKIPKWIDATRNF